MTKRDRLLALLKRGGWIGQWQMLRAGGMRYGARLWDLRRLGYRVEVKCLGDGEYLYRMRRNA